MLIKNTSALVGENLDYISNIDIKIRDGKFLQIKSNIKPNRGEKSIDCEGLLAVPGFINGHTHLGDSIAKDVFLDGTIDKRIHPVFGIKPKILKNTKDDHLTSIMRNSCISMMKKGITTFVDFREGETAGILLLKRATFDLPIRAIILGRLEQYHNHSQIKQNARFPRSKKSKLDDLLKNCDGLGISGANENSDSVLKLYSKTAKLRAIHSAETLQSTSASLKITAKSEPTRALQLRPHFLIHMTYATRKDLCLAARRSTGIVVCPRANASLAEGIPDINLMLKSGCTISLGTDNVMLNSPDMFKEMDYLWKVTMGMRKMRVEPREILKMATVNGGKILGKNIGNISNNMIADCIFFDKHALDLEPMHNPHASIIHRASESSIRAVMIGGNIIFGKL